MAAGLEVPRGPRGPQSRNGSRLSPHRTGSWSRCVSTAATAHPDGGPAVGPHDTRAWGSAWGSADDGGGHPQHPAGVSGHLPDPRAHNQGHGLTRFPARTGRAAPPPRLSAGLACSWISQTGAQWRSRQLPFLSLCPLHPFATHSRGQRAPAVPLGSECSYASLYRPLLLDVGAAPSLGLLHVSLL